MLSSARKGLKAARPVGGLTWHRRVGEGVVRVDILDLEYRFDFPMTHESTATAFYTLQRARVTACETLTIARYIFACVVFRNACSTRLPSVL
jgi:hypothetical protein